MKTFKEYRNKKIKFVDGPLSFAELREKKQLTEENDYKKYDKYKEWCQDQETGTTKENSRYCKYNSNFHDPIEPKNITESQQRAILLYTTYPSSNPFDGHSSSGNINAYLRNRAGNKINKIINGHKPKEVENAVKNLSSAYTKENTNPHDVETYGAVPSSVGNDLESMKKGDSMYFAGFTSTSSSRITAQAFARDYARAENSDIKHIIHYHAMPHTGISVVQHSAHEENEFLLHHGAHVEYSHTDHYEEPDTKLHIHHVSVHPDHLPLEKYGHYDY